MIYHGLAALALVAVLVGAAWVVWPKSRSLSADGFEKWSDEYEYLSDGTLAMVLHAVDPLHAVDQLPLPDDPDALTVLFRNALKRGYVYEESPRGRQARAAFGKLQSASGGPRSAKKRKAVEFDDAAMAERKPDGDVAFHYIHDYTPAVAEMADENTTYCDAWGRS